MRLTITGAGSPLGRALAAGLAGDELRLVDFPAPSTEGAKGGAAGARVEGDLRDPQVARRAVEGAEALVHLAPLPDAWPPGMPEGEALDLCARGTFELLRAAVSAGVPRVVLGSTLDLFEAYPPGWAVHEGWRPRPGPELRELGPYLAELVGRELARAGWPLLVVCLRLGRLWAGEAAGTPDARSLSLEDALQALRLGLAFRPSDAQRGAGPDGWVVPQTAGWHVFHIPGGRRARFPLAGAAHPSFGYAPRHDFSAYGAPPEPRPARVDAQGRLTPVGETSRTAPAPRAGAPTVTVFGACGPLAAAAAPLLAPSYTLRLTDIISPEDGAARIAERWPEAPRPARPGPPHAFRLVDITDPLAVQDAAQGAEILLNCTVVREQAPGAFRVNTLGAFNVLRAALGQGIRRVVHTGPQILSPDHPAGYSVDFDVPDEVPVRAGANVYFLSKYLALEICRTFAENHGLEVAALLFSTFVNPEQPGRMRGAPGPATVSWGDAGLALRRALEVPALPSPFEAMRILGDLPGAKYSNQKARRILGWAPRDSLLPLWQSEGQPPGA